LPLQVGVEINTNLQYYDFENKQALRSIFVNSFL
jgi:hypothetical protein